MYKLKMNLLYNKEKFCYTKTELLNLMLTLPLPKSDIIDARLESNGCFSIDIPVSNFFYYCYPMLLN